MKQIDSKKRQFIHWGGWKGIGTRRSLRFDIDGANADEVVQGCGARSFATALVEVLIPPLVNGSGTLSFGKAFSKGLDKSVGKVATHGLGVRSFGKRGDTQPDEAIHGSGTRSRLWIGCAAATWLSAAAATPLPAAAEPGSASIESARARISLKKQKTK
jgi:hypothetical protein